MSVILRPRSAAASALTLSGWFSGLSLATASLIGAIVLTLVLALAIPVSASGPEGVGTVNHPSAVMPYRRA
ncbi:MAG TPA: hypothetical protein PKA03_02480 [Tabrizicola sp.]|nr:hypothetical protein [Tabrizicola sp.]